MFVSHVVASATKEEAGKAAKGDWRYRGMEKEGFRGEWRDSGQERDGVRDGS